MRKVPPLPRKKRHNSQIKSGSTPIAGLLTFKQHSRDISGYILLLIIAIAILTPIAFYIARAASLAVSIEAESGAVANTSTLSVNTTDASASGNGFVMFKAAPVATCPAGQTGTPPNCTTPGGGTVSGKFTTKNGGIYDPGGNAFLPRGVNEFGGLTYADWAANISSATNVSKYVDGWKLNMLRIVTCPNGACASYPTTAQVDSYDQIINAYTAKKVVVMLDYHGLDFAGTPPSASDVTTATNWFKQVAAKYKDNPYVWYETYNEVCDDLFQDINGTSCGNFPNYEETTIQAIRSVNSNAFVVVCTGQYGQDRESSSGAPDTANDSMIMKYGPGWQTKYGNIAWDLHVYDRWGQTSTAQMKSYFQTLHNADVSVLVGETGGVPGGGAGDDSGANWNAAQTLMNAKAPGVGVTFWSAVYFNLTTSDRATDINSNTSPTNLSAQGQAFWNWTHNPPQASP